MRRGGDIRRQEGADRDGETGGEVKRQEGTGGDMGRQDQTGGDRSRQAEVRGDREVTRRSTTGGRRR